MPQRSVATNFTFEQQRQEINLLAADFTAHETTVNTAASTYLKHDGSNNFTGQTLAVPNAFTINANSGGGTVTISGNLDVTGTTTTVSTANLEVTDKNILIGKGSTSDAQADGAGITIDSGTDITFNFVDAKSALVSSIGLEATTFVKAARGQFLGSATPTVGQGVEINAPDSTTGQIISYDRDNNEYEELRVKGSSVGIYGGTSNALVGSFSSTGLDITGALDVTGNIANSAGQITCGVHGTSGIQIINDGTFGTLHNVDLVLRTNSAERAKLDKSTGDFTLTNTNAKFISESSSSTKYIRLYAASGTGQWDIYGNNADLRFSDNATAGNVVFDRNIDANGGITGNLTGAASQVTLGNDSSGTAVKRVLFSSADTGNVTIQADTSDGITYKPSDGTLSVQKLEGTIVTAAQASITSVGTLSTLNVVGAPATGTGLMNLRTHASKDSYVKFRDASDFDSALTDGGLAIDCRNSDNNTNRHMILRSTELRLNLGTGGGTDTLRFKSDEMIPISDATYDLGDPSFRFANVYTGDMHLNNMNTGGNEVDGSEGHWTMQEGSDDLFLINRNTGKKYKFNLTEVS